MFLDWYQKMALDVISNLNKQENVIHFVDENCPVQFLKIKMSSNNEKMKNGNEPNKKHPGGPLQLTGLSAAC